MEVDFDRIDEAVLALRYLALRNGVRARKGRLHRKGMIRGPAGTAKSVMFTDVGLAESERLSRKLFVNVIRGGKEPRCEVTSMEWTDRAAGH